MKINMYIYSISILILILMFIKGAAAPVPPTLGTQWLKQCPGGGLQSMVETVSSRYRKARADQPNLLQIYSSTCLLHVHAQRHDAICVRMDVVDCP